jgi:hypothetical protein
VDEFAHGGRRVHVLGAPALTVPERIAQGIGDELCRGVSGNVLAAISNDAQNPDIE